MSVRTSSRRLDAALAGSVEGLRVRRAHEHWTAAWFTDLAAAALDVVEAAERAQAPAPLFVTVDLTPTLSERAEEYLYEQAAELIGAQASLTDPPPWMADLATAHWLSEASSRARAIARRSLCAPAPDAVPRQCLAVHLLGVLVDDVAELLWRLLRLGPDGASSTVLHIVDEPDCVELVCGQAQVMALRRDTAWWMHARGHVRSLGATTRQVALAAAYELVETLADPYDPDAWARAQATHIWRRLVR